MPGTIRANLRAGPPDRRKIVTATGLVAAVADDVAVREAVSAATGLARARWRAAS